MSKVLNIFALALYAASPATCEARGNLRRLQTVDYLPPHSVTGEALDGGKDVLANDENIVELLTEVIEDSSKASVESSSEDEEYSVMNYNEIPVVRVPGSSSDSEDARAPMDTSDPYAERPVFSDDSGDVSMKMDTSDPHSDKMEAKSLNVDMDEVAAVVQSYPDDAKSLVAKDEALVWALQSIVGEDPNVKGDAVPNNYFIGTDIGGMENMLGMEGTDMERGPTASMEESEEEFGDYYYSSEEEEDTDENHDELPVMDPDEEADM